MLCFTTGGRTLADGNLRAVESATLVLSAATESFMKPCIKGRTAVDKLQNTDKSASGFVRTRVSTIPMEGWSKKQDTYIGFWLDLKTNCDERGLLILTAFLCLQMQIQSKIRVKLFPCVINIRKIYHMPIFADRYIFESVLCVFTRHYSR